MCIILLESWTFLYLDSFGIMLFPYLPLSYVLAGGVNQP
jgi:hypothetical protein